ncbi:hypothetical protein [Pseudohongiella spirulinae]|uniref:SAM-dependent methyltransferase n=1 Tax=Pseudohongiella spirulinae TaxID=1249552 RepID=A0A0S2KBD9_9GAMM|nr:hypothetical protein [Pseudohongiella spirulinae]ALO45608.1 hypothetical protein PS2015_938 [Pseudohongiella spirulinae]
MTSTEILPSRLMPDIIERLENRSPLMVLDVGMGVKETVSYFGSRRCRLHFSAFHEALFSPPKIKNTQPVGQVIDKKAEEQSLYDAWLKTFQSAMSFEASTRFDVCLFWDFFNYLDDIPLAAFSEALRPFIKPETLAHAYLLLKPSPDVMNREYGIHSPGEISVRPGTYSALTSFPRPQARVTGMLKGFAVNHSVLRRDGLLEVSLKAAR